MLEVEELLLLEARAERGEWSALRELPIELWPWPMTPAMEETLRNLPADEKRSLEAIMGGAAGAPESPTPAPPATLAPAATPALPALDEKEAASVGATVSASESPAPAPMDWTADHALRRIEAEAFRSRRRGGRS